MHPVLSTFVYAKKSIVVTYYTTVLTWDIHSTWGCASQTPRH